MGGSILKLCCTCKEHKALDAFGASKQTKDNLKRRCKLCHNADNARYRLENPETSRASSLAWQKNNPEKADAKRKRFLASRPGYEARRQMAWRSANPEISKAKSIAANRKRLQNPAYRMHNAIGNGLRNSLKNKQKTSKTFDILGYTIQEFMAHIERQFLKGMAWDNFGDWHIDHIQPVSSFKIESQDDPELIAAWGLPNLRPIWAAENLRKSASRTHLV